MKAKEIINVILDNNLDNTMCGTLFMEADEECNDKQLTFKTINHWFGKHTIIKSLMSNKTYFYMWSDLESEPIMENPDGIAIVTIADQVQMVYFWEIED